MKIASLERKGNSVIFTGERMHIYIPNYYFEKKLAEYNGKYINTMGIFLFEITSDEKYHQNKDGIFHTLKLPVKMNFEYDSRFSIKRKIQDNDMESYQVFILRKDNIFLDNEYKEQNAQYCKDFVFSMLHNGNIPNIISYDDIIKLYLSNMDITKVKLRNPSVIFEIIISEACRYRKNLKIPFRKVAGRSGNVSMKDYKNINIKQIPSLNSTFADIAFENFSQSVITSVNKTRSGVQETESPIEKTIKY